MSEWQTPQNLMSIRTSLGPSARRSISNAPSGASGASVPTARAVVVFEAGAVKVLVAMPKQARDGSGPEGGALTPPLSPTLRSVDRRAEIREFLISRRAKVTPDDVGVFVAEDDVRRVPGLRREEVADLAGVSVDYYTQLERGDVDGASDGVLNAVARALQLDDAERLHLFDLARAGIAARLAPSRGVIRPTLQQTLDAFTGGMALVRNRRWDYLAANALGRAVYEEMFDGRTGNPNHVRYVFLDERAREFFDDWPRVAQDTARILRSETGRDPDDPEPAALVKEVSEASAEFRSVWA